MRVLGVGSIYPPHHLGGYEVIWRGVMRHLREQGHEVRILATDFRREQVSPDAGEDPDVHRELDWYWRDHEWRRLGFRQRLELERRNAATFDRHVREFRPDAVTWWLLGGMSLSLVERARRAGIPATFFVLDYWLSYGREHDLWTRTWRRLKPLAPLGERIAGVPTRIDYADAGRWVFCSETMRRHALANGLRRADTTVLTPGVERSLLQAGQQQESREWRWRLLYAGRVVAQKGVGTAIEALAQLPPEAELKVVGDGDRAYRDELERLASALGVRERVHFHGLEPRERMSEVYRDADAVVFPVQWAEPWGLVPLEAMALGRPVVATGRGGSGDYLRDRENALLFEPGDASGLAQAVRTLAEDPVTRGELVARGRETAARHDEDSFNRLAAEQILAAAGAPTARPSEGAGAPMPPRAA
jgi:glycosyltransferase involved in cell wall biosynthesis